MITEVAFILNTKYAVQKFFFSFFSKCVFHLSFHFHVHMLRFRNSKAFTLAVLRQVR